VFFGRFSASGKGSSKTRETNLSTLSKTSPGNLFSGDFFPGGFLLLPFLSAFFVALVKRLSVRGTQKRNVFFYGVVRVISCRFFLISFLGVSR
jgi:hypothetical protein